MDDPVGLRRKLLWLIGLRAALATVLLAAATFASLRGVALPFPVDPFLAFAGVTYALTLAYLLSLRFSTAHAWLRDVQLAGDALLVSALVLVTGGVESYYSTVYVLPIVAASCIQFRRGGILVATLSAALYACVVVAQYTGALGLLAADALSATGDRLPPARIALFTVGVNVTGFVIVAVLTGYLAEGLRRAGEHLEHASTEIADLRALSAHVIDSLTGGLATTDRAGRVLTLNRAAERILGVRAEAVRGRTVREVLQLPATFVLPLGGAAADPRGERSELRFERENGTVLDLGLTAAPLVTGSGRAGWIFTFQDLTDAKRAERDAQMQKRLAAVGEMAAGIAHEIRNPLASMSGSIQILRRELTLTPDQAELMDIVLRESERLNETIRNFLSYARPRPLSAGRFDAVRLLHDAATLLRNSPDCRGHHTVLVEVPSSPLWFEGDESVVRQIVWNLATNALRAMPLGGRLWLRVEPADQDEYLVLVVRDEGLGIPPEDLDCVFHPFRSTFAKGTGLGLAIVHRIVTDHGGEIAVASTPGRGTEMRVALRRVAPADASRGRRAAEVA